MLGFGLRFIWSYWLCKVYMHMVYSAADNVFMAHRQWQGWLDLSNITQRLQQNTTISQHIGSWNFILPLLWSCCVAWTCRYFKFRKSTYLYITFQRFMNTSRTQDTLDPRLFSTICLRYRSVLLFTAGAEVSLGHFVTSAELSQHFMKGPKCPTDTSALVPNCLGQIGGVFLFLYHFTTSCHIFTIRRDVQTASQDIFVYKKSYLTFKFES